MMLVGAAAPNSVRPANDLTLEQRVLDVMPELDHERREPHARDRPTKPGNKSKCPTKHDQGIAIVQHLRVHEPGNAWPKTPRAWCSGHLSTYT